MQDCTITRDGEKFALAVDTDSQAVTVTDQYGKVGTIAPRGGGLLRVTVGTTNSGASTMDEAVSVAARFLKEQRIVPPTDDSALRRDGRVREEVPRLVGGFGFG